MSSSMKTVWNCSFKALAFALIYARDRFDFFLSKNAHFLLHVKLFYVTKKI